MLKTCIFVASVSCLLLSCVSAQAPLGGWASLTEGVDRTIGSTEEIPPQAFSNVLSKNVDGLADGDQTEKWLEDGRQLMTDRRKFGLSGSLAKICVENLDHPFCGAYRFRKAASEKKPRVARAKINNKLLQQKLKQKEFESWGDFSLQSLLSSIKQTKTPAVKSAAESALTSETCLPENVYVSLSSRLENDFPDTEAVTLNNRLLDKNSKCYTTELSGRSAFRLGMFKVWKDQCAEAAPLFDVTLANTSVKYLHARSLYWRDWCKNKSEAAPTAAAPTAEMFKTFPTSFHSLLGEDGLPPSAQTLLAGGVDPLVRFRSSSTNDFNALLTTVDVFLRLGESEVAFYFLENIRIDKLQSEDVDVLLYTAVLCHRAKAELLKFQILTKAFEKNPSVKTVSTMKAFYPTTYMDLVVARKEKLHPHLTMSLVRQESAFNPKAHSVAGARGLMQLLPGTGRIFGCSKKNDLFVPEKNIHCGTGFLAYLMNRYNNQVPLVLAAYNAGPNTVDEWLRRYPTENSLLFIDIIPYRETRDYVTTILRNWYWYNQLYGGQFFTGEKRRDILPVRALHISAPKQ